MTREEALQYGHLMFSLEEDKESAMCDFITTAIKALEQELCEDAISRQAVLDVIEREEFKGDAISEIEKLPSVTPAEKMGQWIPVSEIENIKSEINELSELNHIEPTYEDCKRDVLIILDKYKASPTGEEVE